MTESIFHAIQEGRITSFWDDSIVVLPLAVYNRSEDETVKNRAMDLFEELLGLDIRGAREALSTWDEYRDWDRILYHKHSAN